VRPTKPPPELADSGGYRQREKVGRIWRRLVVRTARLPRHGAVLDVGCGLGRMAVPLARYLSPRGRYEGFDIDAEAIRWCQDHIATVHHNFRFTAANVHSARYNPGGTASPGSMRLPYEDASFDVAFLASVFTHLLPDAVARYLHELKRVLKPGGRCVASYFLLNEDSERAIAGGRVHSLHRFPERLDGCRVLNLELLESAVAYEEPRLRTMYADSGLAIVEPIGYGSWTGRDAEFSQDVVLAVRPAPPPARGV
jgi:ubiquinone/menaquinone biosynthesis C-methylase UbiE